MTRQTKAYIALIFICIVWGTTYLAIRVVVQNYPAFLFAAIRQLISGAIIMGVAFMFNRNVDLSWKNIKHNGIVGFLLITIGNGCVTWGEKFIPSGVAALICSLMPLSAVMIGLASSSKEKINSTIAAGLGLGLLGVAVIFKDNIKDLTNTSYLIGMIATFVATVSWSLGSVFNKKKTDAVNPMFNSGLQLGIGGIFLLSLSPVVDTYNGESLTTPVVFWSMVYLVIFGSVLAYTAYMYALKELPVGIVALYAYVNPLVAVLLGYFILNEQLTWFTALSFVLIVAGVYTVNYGYNKRKKDQAALTAPVAEAIHE
jgi:drug/metabolite transporter (DMT)-like permease